ncbi:DNA (cytosine-5-)-methyltransferase [Bacillus pacificus]|uniref:Cytosine-specific methyltransferase n=2 Tax=Bacillus cereus group TaxID=86661 RepID=A0A9X8X777_9BACI|nr:MULTISPECIES: DNA (cytosine-5-)-methyltransferase [Bacillus]QHH91764.1 DNA (cytosine-5-)-methyltransferase [Bacillus pacificus]SME19114.1 Modification methylase HhaI [Bacillus paranthracis]
MLNVIELFAGVGGFRVGLERSGGFNFVWANQWEPSKKAQDAYNCYVSHFGESDFHSNEDINKVDETTLPEFELLVGGFPCQDYSVARSLSGELGIQGKKGVLFWDIIRIVENKRPNYILLENVDRLLKSPSSQRGKDFSIMLASLNGLGYNVEWRVINAADYGCAQRRRRVFIFAYRKNAKFLTDTTDFNEILFEKGFFAPIFPVKENPKKMGVLHEQLSDDIEWISEEFKASYFNSGIMIDGTVYSRELLPIEEQSTPLIAILDGNVDEKYYLDESAIEKFKKLKGAKKIERTAKSGHKYIFSEGGMAFPEHLEKPGRTMLTSEGTTNRSTHVVEDPETHRLRYLTPNECEKLNGFEPNWTNTGMSERMRYFCMGNALVVDLVERMGRRINQIVVQEQAQR